MATLLIANNCTRESGSFCGDQLCALKSAYLFVENQPNVTDVIMSVSPGNEMHFLWEKFIDKYSVQLVYDNWNPGDWESRWAAWDKWRTERHIEGKPFDYYRELYLRIHGAQRQLVLCGSERGLARKNIYEYWACGQEDRLDHCIGSDWFDESLICHPPHKPNRDVYISPHAKTQGNITFTFDFWGDVIHRLVDADVTVTAGYDNPWFCNDLVGHPNYHRHWGTHREWMEQVCSHKLVACGNTGTGWLAAACGTPMITMEPHNSVMADHRYGVCGLRNIIEIVDGTRLDSLNNDMVRVAEYVARRIIEEVKRCVVLTTGCYDVIHAGHIRHLERAKALGTRLIVALNSDQSVRSLKGSSRPINPQAQRKAVLEALRVVDEVRVFDELDARKVIDEIRPDVLACGYGYSIEDVVGRKEVEAYGGKVVITYQGDASDLEPSTTAIVKRSRASDVYNACKAAAPYTVNPVEKLKLIAEEFLSVSHLPGDVADLGTCRGGTALFLRRLSDKQLHLFDTWSGTPHDDNLCHHKKGEWPASFEDCQSVVGCESLLTHYYKGVFPDSAMWTSEHPGLDEGRQFCFVYVDMDTYQSTLDALMFFWPRVVPGGKMFLDDCGWPPCAGVEKAVSEFFPPEQLMKVMPTLYSCIVEK